MEVRKIPDKVEKWHIKNTWDVDKDEWSNWKFPQSLKVTDQYANLEKNI